MGAILKDLKAHDRNGYRAFRKRVLKNDPSQHSQEARRPFYSDEEEPHPLQALRKQIVAFRGRVQDSLQSLIQADPSVEPFVRRALGIPTSVPLIPERWSLIRRICQHVVPLPVSWRHIRSVVVQVRTYEGREYIFNSMLARMLPGDRRSLTPGLDLALRYLQTPTWKELDELQMMDPGWMQVAYRIGLRGLAEMEPFARYGHNQLDGEFARMLAGEGVVRTKDELAWIKHKNNPHYIKSREDLHLMRKARRMVRVMLDYGIERRSVASIFRFSVSSFDPQQLDANLKTLRTAGVSDLTKLFEETSELLWRGASTNWSYVLKTIGARSVSDIQLFKRLLRVYHTPSTEFALELKRLGADIQGLAQCQTLILSIGDHDSHAASVAGLSLLAAAPHSMTIEQISQCVDYLSKPNKLQSYLAVLAKYGYGSAAAVLALQVCYRNTSAEDLGRWLAILGNRGEGQAFDVVAEWVRQAQAGGHSDTYEYLLDAIEMPDLKHLQQALPIVGFGRGILRFLVERKRLLSIQSIRDWYFNARGVQGLRWWGQDDEGYLLLLEDAYSRNNFSFVTSNQKCVCNAVDERVIAKLGRRPHPADEGTKAAYDQAYETEFATERATLLPILPGILQQTGGILLRSVIRDTRGEPHILHAQLAALAPLIGDLLAGRGPAASQLNELEVDAVAMLYRTSADLVREAWPEIVGCETDLATLKLRHRYPMEWRRAIRRLKAPLERSSLLSLTQAVTYAEMFSIHELESVLDACKPLRAKRLYEAARDPWLLAAHLGVLLAAAREDSVIAEWVSVGLKDAAEMLEEGAQAFERFERLESLFGSALPDALNQHAERFLRRFNDAEAAVFSKRLVGGKALASISGAQEQLREAFRLTRENVLAVYRRWVDREKRKFPKDKAGHLTTSLVAVLSKHPAAFFAKQAAGICTGNNTAMWKEDRHAHLVVFDPEQRRLAGMALVYFEIVPEIHPRKKTLIMRALNPMDDMLATHTAQSIVDAFFDVAIQIAKDNSFAAVAFPWHNAAHLLSNRPPIERDIERRFIEVSKPMPLRHFEGRTIRDKEDWRKKPRSVATTFFAYERNCQKVGTLYSIWSEDADAPNRADGAVENFALNYASLYAD